MSSFDPVDGNTCTIPAVQGPGANGAKVSALCMSDRISYHDGDPCSGDDCKSYVKCGPNEVRWATGKVDAKDIVMDCQRNETFAHVLTSLLHTQTWTF